MIIAAFKIGWERAGNWPRSMMMLLLLGVFCFGKSIHPGYDLINLRPGIGSEKFAPIGIGGMDFLEDGRLVIATWGGFKTTKGKVFILSGVESGGPQNITIQEIASGLREPMGLKIVKGEIYVVEKTRLIRITDKDSNGVGEITTVYDRWGFDEAFEVRQGTWHAYGLEFVDNYFYVTLSNDRVFWAGVLGKGAKDRGTLIKIPFDGKKDHENLVGGLRNPNGLGIGPDGQFFTTDNQGQWLPSNKLIHLVPGSFYGFAMNPKTPFVKKETKAPTAWIPQDEVGNSPSQPVMVKNGLFKGQLLIGDVHKGGIKRYFLERVKGVYQACIFRFSESNLKNGLEAGVNRMVFGPDGSLYVGGVGGGDAVGLGGWSDWNWNKTKTGLQKLKPNGSSTFEMLAMRSTEDGFEIEFTRPVGKSARKRNTYKVEQWGYAPSKYYGAGNKIGVKKLKVSTVNISADRKKVKLGIKRLKENKMVHIRLRGLLSEKGESIWGEDVWYTLNSKGPADVMGCMDENYLSYNPAAIYDYGYSCKKQITAEAQEKRLNQAKLMANKFKVHKSKKGKVKIEIPFQQPFKVTITNIEGIELASIDGARPTVFKPKMRLKPGVYLIKARVGIATFSRQSIIQ